MLSEYEKERDSFLMKVINNTDYLWDVTEISKNLNNIEGTDDCIELSDWNFDSYVYYK